MQYCAFVASLRRSRASDVTLHAIDSGDPCRRGRGAASAVAATKFCRHVASSSVSYARFDAPIVYFLAVVFVCINYLLEYFSKNE